MAAWSSHGYLAKAGDEPGSANSPQNMNGMGSTAVNGTGIDSGYVLLKRKDDGQMVTVKSPNGSSSGNVNIAQTQDNQPQSLPTITPAQLQYQQQQHHSNIMENDNTNRKYYRYGEYLLFNTIILL